MVAYPYQYTKDYWIVLQWVNQIDGMWIILQQDGSQVHFFRPHSAVGEILLSSPTRDSTWATAMKVLSSNHWTARGFPNRWYFKIFQARASLVVWWLRILLPTRETQVRSRFRKIPHALGQLRWQPSQPEGACAPQEKSLHWEARAPQLERSRHAAMRNSRAKNKYFPKMF